MTGYKTTMGSQSESQEINILQETPPEDVFVAPSVDKSQVISGESYTYHSAIPDVVASDMSIECVLGVDEAGRGPVLGPMVYSLLYLPLSIHHSLLSNKAHQFADSKILTPQTRSQLMRQLCSSTTTTSELHANCGWATRVLSARDISAAMLRPRCAYNLNAQAMDATVELIRTVLERGINVKEIYIDTIGAPQTYQNKLAKIFPTVSITVAKKADSLYPCVSAASVCAKVTRDAALEVLHHHHTSLMTASEDNNDEKQQGWGSGYPSDGRCSSWMRNHMDPVFGWGNECRFSWSTAKDMLGEESGKNNDRRGVRVDWPVEAQDDDGEEDDMRLTSYFSSLASGGSGEVVQGQGHGEEIMVGWFGAAVSEMEMVF